MLEVPGTLEGSVLRYLTTSEAAMRYSLPTTTAPSLPSLIHLRTVLDVTLNRAATASLVWYSSGL